jgi:8-oxo-dGTP diphosphatase
MVIVVGGIIKNNEKLLICRRGKKEPMPGYWEFPGGKIEEGETQKDCLKRELLEELDIDVKVGNLVSNYKFKYPKITVNLFFYDISNFDGEIKKIVHDKIIWEKVENFAKYEFLPGNIPIINKLMKKCNEAE